MGKKMKALVKAKSEPGLWMEEVPVPTPGRSGQSLCRPPTLYRPNQLRHRAGAGFLAQLIGQRVVHVEDNHHSFVSHRLNESPGVRRSPNTVIRKSGKRVKPMAPVEFPHFDVSRPEWYSPPMRTLDKRMRAKRIMRGMSMPRTAHPFVLSLDKKSMHHVQPTSF